MLRRPTNATRRRIAAHACPSCRRLWALTGSRMPSGSWVIACTSCGWHVVRGSEHPDLRPDPHPAVAPGADPGRSRSHGVLLYAADQELVAAVADHLIAGWDAGGVALVVATPEHRAALRDHLAAAGLLDPLTDGRLVELDAVTTLARVMRDDGLPDPEGFERAVGSLVRHHAAHATLHGFGEMVDVLWAAGNAVGALELERLWAQLQAEVPFSTLCAYAQEHVDDVDRVRIRRAHDVSA